MSPRPGSRPSTTSIGSAGRRPRLNLGRYDQISLAKARKLAAEAHGLLLRGLDPAIHLHSKEEASLPSTTETVDAVKAPVFSSVLQDYISKYLVPNCKDSTRKEVARNLRAHFLQVWATIPIDEITTHHITSILDAKTSEGKPSAAIHAHSHIKTFFNWCVRRSLIAASPAEGLPKPASPKRRARYLKPDEIRALWLATEAEPNVIAKFIQVALVTGQRRGEIASMRWDELHMEDGYWEVPGARTKNGKDHIVPLSFLAKEILLSIPKAPLPIRPGEWEIRFSPYVFPSPRRPENMITNFSDSKERLEQVAGINSWCIHDLRRTVATGLAELGVQSKVRKKLFNHSENEVHDIYDRFDYFKERCEAMHLWALHLQKAISGSIQTQTGSVYKNPYATRGDSHPQT